MNLLGKLDWTALPLHEPIIMGATAFMVLVVVAVLGFITMKGAWLYLWREWLTSVDHKRIGVMYCILALVMMLRGFSDAIMMRAQQAVAAGGAQGYLPPEHFDQIFSAHGTIMIFFMAMPFVVGIMNFAVPLQLGIRDVAFPTLNSVSFWLTASGATTVAQPGTSFRTTLPAPTLHPAPRTMLPSTLAPAEISTPSRTFGCRSPCSLPVPPSVTS